MLEETMRENKLYLQIATIESMRFVTKACIASDGQPIENAVQCQISEDGISWVLTFKAGRHGSEKVAEQFIQYVTDGGNTTGATIACETGESKPEKLNFAFLGDLYIKKRGDDHEYVGEDVVIAQGHNKRDANNWWLGGRNMVNLIDAKVIKGVEQTFNVVDAILPGIYLLGFMPYMSEPNRFTISYIDIGT